MALVAGADLAEVESQPKVMKRGPPAPPSPNPTMSRKNKLAPKPLPTPLTELIKAGYVVRTDRSLFLRATPQPSTAAVAKQAKLLTAANVAYLVQLTKNVKALDAALARSAKKAAKGKSKRGRKSTDRSVRASVLAVLSSKQETPQEIADRFGCTIGTLNKRVYDYRRNRQR